MSNRLAQSTSPYLLQHAHNPVDWHEWGSEALQKAVAQDKPILVSIGYSACHWCHVMERECFENKDIAQIMNEYFVCIKVDREERPDIDNIYMEAVQAMQQGGGWPLNVFLTPDQKPFFGGTYFPPNNWTQLLLQINKAFRGKRNEINASAEDLRIHLQTNDVQRFAKEHEVGFNQASLDQMFNTLAARFDKTWGGIEKAPKFVMPSVWHFLLRYYFITKNKEALHMTTHTLRQMLCGGIYDQLGGGFSRYSVDAEWFAPHFEKMLYDNAQLLSLYSEAFSITRDQHFKNVVYETVAWLTNEMAHPDGGFYSALDADSEGVEGKFYTWTEEEIKNILGDEEEAIASFYQTTPEGNWEHGRNIFARSIRVLDDPEPSNLKNLKAKLLTHRDKRVRPGLDDKILTGWNAMTIQGLTDAYKAFGDGQFLADALNAISFLEFNLMANGKVYRAYKNKHSQTEGFLEDYAYLIQAYTSLYQVTFNEGWLHKAEVWCQYVLKHFLDREDGFFHFSSQSAEQLIARKKEIFDNVIPASNSVMAHNLHTLGILLDKDDWKDLAIKMTSKLLSVIESGAGHMSNWGILLSEIIYGMKEVVISGEDALSTRHKLHQEFLPFTVTAGTTKKSELPLLEGRESKPGQTLIYVCQNKTCQLPVELLREAINLIK
jgi:uncharacterized protein